MQASTSLKIGLAFGALIALCATPLPRADACECPTAPSASEALESSEMVFTGWVAHSIVVGDYRVIQFSTAAVWRGPGQLEQTVIASVGECGWSPTIGEQYLVYTSASPDDSDVSWVDGCGRTAPRQSPQLQDYDVLGTGHFHAPSRFDPRALTDETAELIARRASESAGGDLHAHVTRAGESVQVVLSHDEAGADVAHTVAIDVASQSVVVL